MRNVPCTKVRGQIAALHDGELTIAQQIAARNHIEQCQGCAEALAELQLIRLALRASKSSGLPLSRDQHVGFVSAVVGRAWAEEQLSLRTRVRQMFAGLQIVYAGLGAAVAALVCTGILLGMARLAANESPGSLAAMLRIASSPGSNENPVAVGARVTLPRALGDPFAMPSIHIDDAVFALSGVVTREGRAQHLELLRPNVDPAILMDLHKVRLVDDLMFVLSETQFEPASRAGLPVAVSMVWIVAHTTVRGTLGTDEEVTDPPASPAPPANRAA